jgi:5'-methylthioadenosine phosphorylase
MAILGILSGTMPLFDLGLFDYLERKSFACPSGKVTYLAGDDLILFARHGWQDEEFTPPHLVNHLAHFQTLSTLGVSEIIGVYSTGSLQTTLTPGMLTVPDDFICLYPTPTMVTDKPHHITPILGAGVRLGLLNAARDLAIAVKDGGVYWQTAGPRLETKAEIRLISHSADVVGMTMASEAVLARELDIPFGAICSVDNYAHGIGNGELKEDDIRMQSRHNAEKIGRIVSRYIEQFRIRTRPVDRV